MKQQRSAEFWRGVQAALPILLGVVPFGLIYGVSALSAGIPASITQAMSVIVFAGSAQFIIAKLVGAGTPALVTIITACIVNLRHVLYSVSMAPHLRHLSPRWKWLLSYLLIDESYAVSITRYQDTRDTTFAHWYFFGAGLALWSVWQVSTAAGMLLGAQLPASWPLDFAIPLTFIALVVPMLKDRASGVAALAAVVVVVVAAGGLPYKLDLIVATLVGMAAGLGWERP